LRLYNYEEYKAEGKKIECSVYPKEIDLPELDKIEEDYWKLCSDQERKILKFKFRKHYSPLCCRYFDSKIFFQTRT
jgi:hypothetical protein